MPKLESVIAFKDKIKEFMSKNNKALEFYDPKKNKIITLLSIEQIKLQCQALLDISDNVLININYDSIKDI